MKKISFLLALIILILTACNSDQVKIRGKVEGLNGTVKLLAELPGQPGMVILAQQEVKDGDINLKVNDFKIPGRVWVDIDGKRTLEAIVDTKDQIWIQGKIKFPTEIVVKGSGLMENYADLKKQYKEKYEDQIAKIDKSIENRTKKEKMTKDDEVMIGIYQLQKQKHYRQRFAWTKELVKANPTQEISLFLIKDELGDSLHVQKELFKNMRIENKESNIYQVLEAKLK